MRHAQPVNVFRRAGAYQSTVVFHDPGNGQFRGRQRSASHLQTCQRPRIEVTAEVLLEARRKDRFLRRRLGE